MKVCYVSEGGRSITGTQRSLLNLVEKEMEKDVEPFIVCHRNWEFVKIANKKGIQTKVIPVFQYRVSIEIARTLRTQIVFTIKRILNMVNYPRVVRYLIDNDIEIVHLNSLLSSHVWAQAAKKCAIPYVWHIREFMFEDYKRTFIRPDMMKNLLKNASAVIAISEAVKNFWQDWSGREINLVYNGLPYNDYFIQRDSLFRTQDIHLIIVGRISEGKGQLDVIKALNILHEKGYENLYLKIVGYRGITDYEHYVKKYIGKSKIKNAIELMDFTYDLKSIREKCDIGITASVSEAFGRVTVENMLAGLVTVGADTGGTPEIVKDGETGYLYHQGDPEDLARVLENILRDKEEATLVAKKGQDYAHSHFSISRTADEVYEVYRRVLKHE